MLADTRDEVVELLKNDIYSSSGVWDVEKVSWPLLASIFPSRDVWKLKLTFPIGSDLACKSP